MGQNNQTDERGDKQGQQGSTKQSQQDQSTKTTGQDRDNGGQKTAGSGDQQR